MSTCQHCTRTTQLHLCTPCATNLRELLAELPWLLHQLDVTLCRRDHLNSGGPGHTHVDANPINVGAMELMRQASATLHAIALDLVEVHALTRIPALVNASPALIAWWLKNNLRAIQNHPKAGEHYTAIYELVGDPNPGPIHHAINRGDRHFAGPCPTPRAHNRDGTNITCNTMLYAHDGEPFVTCPRCKCQIDAETNRRRAATDNDLLPENHLLDALTAYGAPTTTATLTGWIAAGRLPARGYLTRKGIAKHPTRRSDPEVYSFHAALHLTQNKTPTTCTNGTRPA